uniref:Uncharacterized protein n=2 Tax=Phaeomonas parva TaxID=124430 RepID=A0A6U4JXM0_9STRA|mmetsp:Transcript_45075/g.141175  ORF Transcript_45075/g.141175 Transcript_45075/m.141175 type:complete len:173 (+) Transcript_45075:384-902(+)
MSDPLRVLGTVWDEDKINVVDAARGDFELTLKRLNFVMLKFQPRVAVKIKWDEAERCILMDSDTFHLDGLERLDVSKTISVDVEGRMAVVPEGKGGMRLKGSVAFVTSGQIPRVLRLTPGRALKVAGTAINAQILEYVKLKFLGPLIGALRGWEAKSKASLLDDAPSKTSSS